MGFMRDFCVRFLVAAFAMVFATGAWGNSLWQIQLDPTRFNAAMAVPSDQGNVASFSCTQPGAPTQTNTGLVIRPHTPGQLIFLLNPSFIGASGAQVSVAITVDGQALGTVPLQLAQPENQFATVIPSNHAIFQRLRAGNQLDLVNGQTGQKVTVPLAGFTAAFNQLVQRCQTAPGQDGNALAQAPAISGPSFDCARASTSTEQSICRNPQLAQKDVLLSQAYNAALAALPAGQQEQLRQIQRAWLAQRNRCGRNVACLDQAMTSQIGILNATAGRSAPSTTGNTGAAQQPAQPSGLGGFAVLTTGELWYGDLVCERYKNVEAEFNITGRNAQGQFTATLSVFRPESLMQGTSKAQYLGEQNAQGSIQFVVVKQLRGGIGMDNRAGFVFDPTTGKGKFDARDRCSTLSLKRVPQDSPRLVSSQPRPANGGSYYAAATPRDKCEALLTWVGRLNSEYPGVDFYRVRNTTEIAWQQINLYADADFVPVFGVPYDAMPYDRRVDVRTFVNRTCNQDPFVKPRLEIWRAAADRTLVGGGQNNELTSNGYTSTVFAIRKIRELRNEIALLSKGNASDPEGLKRKYDALGERLALLWPSERSAMEKRLKDGISRQARETATKDVTKVLAIADPAVAVQSANSMLAKLNGQFGQLLQKSDLDQYRNALKAHRAAAVDKITKPYAATLRAYSNDMKGAQGIAAALKSPPGTLNVLSNDEKNALLQEAEKQLKIRLDGLVAQRVASLETFSGDLAGLQSSVAWIDQFEADFDEFPAIASITSAKRKFRSVRENQLEAALGEFELGLIPLETDEERDGLMTQFLSWSQDETLPIFLEYELVRLSAE